MIATIDAVDHDVWKVVGSVVRNASTAEHDDGQQQEDRDVEEERQRAEGDQRRGRAGPCCEGPARPVRQVRYSAGHLRVPAVGDDLLGRRLLVLRRELDRALDLRAAP